MNRNCLPLVWFLVMCLSSIAYPQKPIWKFSVIAAVSKATSDQYGGYDAVKLKIRNQFTTINARFNIPGVFNGIFEFSVDSIYIFSGDPVGEIYVRHPGFDYSVIYDAFPTQGGGWYGRISTIHHSWSWYSWGGIFGNYATDGLIHEFGHARGAIDLYAIEVEASNNPINHTTFEAEQSIMNYPYGERKWDEHTIHIINFNNSNLVYTTEYITSAFSDTFTLKIYNKEGFPAAYASVMLYPIEWYSYKVDTYASSMGAANQYGVFNFGGINPYGPGSYSDAWNIQYPNFVLRVICSDTTYYRFLPITEIQNHYFNMGNSPYLITLGEEYQPLSQTISFSELNTCTYGDEGISLNAEASSGLPVRFETSDSNVVQIDGNLLQIINAGQVDIIALQDGDKYYAAAQPIVQTLVIDKKVLEVTVMDTSKIYGEENPEPTITYQGFVGTDNMDSLDVLPVTSCEASAGSCVGSYFIQASGAEDQNYLFSYKQGILTIHKKDLIITVMDTFKIYGDENPEPIITYQGLVGTDTKDSLDTLPVILCDATVYSCTGTYPLRVADGWDNNYKFVYNNGMMTIQQRLLTIFVLDTTSIYGESIPAFSLSYNGFVNEDIPDSIDIKPVPSCPATHFSCAGNYPIQITGGMDNNYQLKLIGGELHIIKSLLRATVENTSKTYGEPNPQFYISYQGLKNNDVIDSLDQLPIIHCDANENTDVGEVVVSLSGGWDNNYEFSNGDGILTILQAEQYITFDQIEPVTLAAEYINLSATSSSGLKVDFISANPEIASIEGDKAVIHHAGTTVISAHQEGNHNYLAAESVSQNLVINLITQVELPEGIHVSLYPNPVSDILHISSELESLTHVRIYDLHGDIFYERRSIQVGLDEVNVSNFANGIYLMEIRGKKNVFTYKFLVKHQ